MEDLESYNIRTVGVAGFLHLDEEQRLHNILEKHQDGWPNTPIDKLGFYEVGDARHHLGLDIGMMGETKRVLFEMEAHVFLREEGYESDIRLDQERQYDDIQSILEDLKEIQARGNVSALITWIFPPDSKTPIISLPMLTVQGPNLPFSEISGVHLKRETSEGTVHIIMDLRDDHALGGDNRVSTKANWTLR